MQSCCRLLRNDLMKNRCFRAFIIPVLLLCLSVQSMPAQNDMPDGRFIAISFIEINSGYARCIDSTCVDSSYINIISKTLQYSQDKTMKHCLWGKDIPCFSVIKGNALIK